MTDEPTVLYKVRNTAYTITLNRQRILKTINNAVKTEFVAAFDRAEGHAAAASTGTERGKHHD